MVASLVLAGRRLLLLLRGVAAAAAATETALEMEIPMGISLETASTCHSRVTRKERIWSSRNLR